MKNKILFIAVLLLLTACGNSPFQGWQIIENRSFDDGDWTRWVEHARAVALPGALEFTRFADSLGVAFRTA